MRKTFVVITMGCCLPLVAAVAQGQAKPKPGLWEVTSSMNMAGMPQMPQMPQGAQMPPGMQMPASPMAPHTTQVCVTQAMIDKFGGPYTNPPRGDCKMSDISVKPGSMTANMQCTGQITATGTVKSTFVDANTAKTTVHLTGTMQMGPTSRPVDMTMDSTSTYKGADCGDVKPMTMPAGN